MVLRQREGLDAFGCCLLTVYTVTTIDAFCDYENLPLFKEKSPSQGGKNVKTFRLVGGIIDRLKIMQNLFMVFKRVPRW